MADHTHAETQVNYRGWIAKPMTCLIIHRWRKGNKSPFYDLNSTRTEMEQPNKRIGIVFCLKILMTYSLNL